jgi:preprotein translocase subunit Sss1
MNTAKTSADQAAIREAYEDFCLSFFMELRDKYHYRLSAQELLNFLQIEQIDLADETCVCTNMMMFFCHQQYECEKFPEIFHTFYCSEKNEAAMRLRKLEKQQGRTAGENRNAFLQKPTGHHVTDQKVHFSLPNFKAERFFAQFELQEGICDYSEFLHAGFLNLYEDYISYYDTLDDIDRKKLIDTLVSELQRFIHYCKRVLDDPEDFNRKSLELAATFQMAGNREAGAHGNEDSDEDLDEEALNQQIEEQRLHYQQLEDTRVPLAEDFTKKDIRLLTKHDMEQIEQYIRENAHKFKARVSRNLKKPGRRTLTTRPP